MKSYIRKFFEDSRVRKSSYAQNLEDLTTRLYSLNHNANFVENQCVNYRRFVI